MKVSIPIHKLNERSESGLEMIYFDSDSGYKTPLFEAHRDDHYIFIFQECGKSTFMLDFKTMFITDRALLYVLPGQVHHSIKSDNARGWFLAIDTLLVGEEYRAIFEHYILSNDTLTLDAAAVLKLKQCAQLLFEQQPQMTTPLGRQIAYSLALSYIGMIAATYVAQHQHSQKENSRPLQINTQFRKLLLNDFKEVKSPSEYAAKLNISATYLNESVKSVTGFPVTYWIHQEVILEAKRLLYYSDLSVKEIAFELGFADHTYFSRLFTKIAGISAGKFRNGYRK